MSSHAKRAITLVALILSLGGVLVSFGLRHGVNSPPTPRVSTAQLQTRRATISQLRQKPADARPIPADNATVFATDTVHRIDIDFTAASWKALQASLPRHGDLAGVFGEQFPSLHAACHGLRHYDVCQMPNAAAGTAGRCRGPDDGLACLTEAMARSVGGSLMPAKAFFPCTVRYQGQAWANVGFRFKGGSSFNTPYLKGSSQKYPFRLHMDQFTQRDSTLEKQSFFGFRKLTFANGVFDHTFMRDLLTNHLYNALEVPAAKVAFYRVYLNHGQGPYYYGLFTMIEDPDGPMIDTRYGAPGGNLYKPIGGGASWKAFNRTDFVKQSNRAQADWGDVERAVTALHDKLPEAQWRTNLEKYFDVDLFLRWLAVTVFTSPSDAHGFGTSRNYYLYGDPSEEGRLKWIPWDNDMSFTRMAQPFLEDVTDFPLIRRLLDDRVYFTRYRKVLREIISGPAKPELLIAEIRKHRQLIAPFVQGPDGEQAPYTHQSNPAAWDKDFVALENFITHRHETLLAALDDSEKK